MIKHLFIQLGLLLFAPLCYGQQLSITPPNWWTQMGTQPLVLVVENAPIGITDVSLANSSIKVIKHYPAANKNFHIIEIDIPPGVNAHTAKIVFKTTFQAPVTYSFRISERPIRSESAQLNAGDAIYQLIPDRFCNGNTGNDNVQTYFEKKDRLNPTGIHGGDIEGIISNLDYITKLGCTALEIMPVTESNLMMNSYKRLASTNLYEIDKRLGTIGLYKEMIDDCQSRDLKFIQTFTLHQIGNKHPYFQQMIDADFFNGLSYDFDSPSTDFSILTDPYSPESLKKVNRQLWNKPNFPTLNQDNKLVRQLLIQQLIWWIETADLKNIKIEQAGSNSPELITELYSSLSKHYDDLSIILDNPSLNNHHAYWSQLSGDIPTFIVNYNYADVLSNAFSPYADAETGTRSLYRQQLMIAPGTSATTINMLDNHLLNRAFSNADSEIRQLIMMTGHLLCTPGLPSIYYGTEWQIKGLKSKGMSNLAKDFPGGWKSDETSGFNGKGMSEPAKEFYLRLTKLLNWRKDNADLLNGSFTHLLPQSDIYAFMRANDEQSILIIINNSNATSYRFNEEDFAGMLTSYSRCKELLSDDVYLSFKDIIVREKSIAILILEK
ncbi:alpha-amylase family glycosyl hydrolase [Carboxylicivirga sp. RSCT41]|uniref:alpha-amylase family glycosyl hydrolase n=1 Tax=Carboxylicivirga agarovorans TaxID=3417570 RepID=UPI003D337E8D